MVIFAKVGTGVLDSEMLAKIFKDIPKVRTFKNGASPYFCTLKRYPKFKQKFDKLMSGPQDI